jgi:hypothetical protein
MPGRRRLCSLILLPRLRTHLRTRYPGAHALRSVFQFGATALFSGADHAGVRRCFWAKS